MAAPHGTNDSCNKDKQILKGMALQRDKHTHKVENTWALLFKASLA